MKEQFKVLASSSAKVIIIKKLLTLTFQCICTVILQYK